MKSGCTDVIKRTGTKSCCIGSSLMSLEPWDRLMWADIVKHKSYIVEWIYSWHPLTLSSRWVLQLERRRHSSQHTFIGNYASSQLRHLLQVASASSEPSAHSGSPSQRHRAGTHWPFLQVKSVVAHVLFAVENNVTLETPQQRQSSVIFNLLTRFRCKMCKVLFALSRMIYLTPWSWFWRINPVRQVGASEWMLQGYWSSLGVTVQRQP